MKSTIIFSIFIVSMLCIFRFNIGTAQSILLGNYSFDNCEINDLTGNTSFITTGAPLVCGCGIDGDAINFDGSAQFIDLTESSSASIFTRASLSVSFYFRPIGTSGQMVLVSKKETCLSNSGFSIKYNAATREIIAEFAESANNRVVLRGFIDIDRCWQHVVVTRFTATHRLIINNKLKHEAVSAFTLNMTNDSELLIGSGPCVGSTDVRFEGLLNNLRFYSPELSLLEVNAIFPNQDKLLNRDTTIFLGSSFPARPSFDCGLSYSWSPTLGVSDPTANNPDLAPEITTMYVYSINYSGCIARDTLNITVVDPSLLDCENLPMPNAFTPNRDGLNETFFISNPYTYDELIHFEIFERNGGQVFATNNSFEGWDGNFKGQAMPPGNYLYMIKFKCGDKNLQKTGTFMLIR